MVKLMMLTLIFGLSVHVVQMETAAVISNTRYYVMAVTPTRLYSFTGIGSLEVRS